MTAYCWVYNCELSVSETGDQHRPIHSLRLLIYLYFIFTFMYLVQQQQQQQQQQQLDQRRFSKHKLHAGCRCTHPSSPGSDGMVLSVAEWCYLQQARCNAFSLGRKFVSGDFDLWPLTLTFKLFRPRDQTDLPCEFGTNPFSGSQNMSHTNKQTNKKVTAPKNRTLYFAAHSVR